MNSKMVIIVICTIGVLFCLFAIGHYTYDQLNYLFNYSSLKSAM